MSFAPPPPAPVAGSSSGFKLVLKRSAPSGPPPPPAPSTSTSALAYLADTALEQLERQPLASYSGGDVSSRPVQAATRETAAAPAAAVVVAGGEQESRGVSSSKYRALRRSMEDATETRDDAQMALFRAQKLIVRLREEKSALLDRVLELESAAGLPEPEIALSRDPASLTDSQRDFPLLSPPALPSLADRPRPTPSAVTTTTDLTSATYTNPVVPPPLSQSLPPRQRSIHMSSTLAAQHLRDNADARRIARGLPIAPYPIVAVLGLEGSVIAGDVERAFNGEAPRTVERKSKSSKRKRDANGERVSSKGKGKSEEGLPLPTMDVDTPVQQLAPVLLSNPYEGIAGMSHGGRGDPTAIAAAWAATAAAEAAAKSYAEPEQPEDDLEYDRSRQESITSCDDHEYAESPAPSQSASGRRARRSPDTMTRDKSKAVVKPKRLKASGIVPGTYVIPAIPRNPDHTPRLPLPVGIMVLKSLGVVDPRETFHTERYIFPVGFECIRKYPSMIHPNDTVEYTSRIVDGGSGAPRFEIDASDQPGVIISAGTPTGAWAQIVRTANALRNRQHSNSVSGPDYYGLAQNVIKALIQELPGAQDVSTYIQQVFKEDEDHRSNVRSHKRLAGGAVGPNKVIGAKRKPTMLEGLHPKPEFEDEGQMRPRQIQPAYNDPSSYSRSPSDLRRSTSPRHGGPNGGYHDSFAGSSSIGNLLHHQATVNHNPYSLPIAVAPPAVPAIDPSLGAAMGAQDPFYNAYALPSSLPLHSQNSLPPQNGYHSPQMVDPTSASHHGGWQPDPYAIGRGSPSFAGNVALDPAFLQEAYGMPPQGGNIHPGFDLPVGQGGFGGLGNRRPSSSGDESV